MIVLLMFAISVVFCFTGIFVFTRGSRRETRTMLDQVPPHPFDRPKIVNTTLEPPEDLTQPIGVVLAWARQRATYEPVRDFVSEGISAILEPEIYDDPAGKRSGLSDVQKKWAQQRGNGIMVLDEGWTFEPVTPAQYSMGTSERGIVSGVLTQNEVREMTGQREQHFSRYLGGIGYVTSDTKEKLDRACEVVLKERWDELEHQMRGKDHTLRAIQETVGYDPAKSRMSETERKIRDERIAIHGKMRLIMEQLTEINNAYLHP